MVKQFTELSAEERQNVLDQRQAVTLLVPTSVANVGDLTKAHQPPDAPGYGEVPPTPIALGSGELAKILVRSGDHLEGRWLRMVLLVYRLGGRILYRKADESTLEALISFREPRMGEKVTMADKPKTIVAVEPNAVEICQSRYCIPSTLGHDHLKIDCGFLFWDWDSETWRLRTAN